MTAPLDMSSTPKPRAQSPALAMTGSLNGDATFEALLKYLKRTRGFDFAAYKRSTLMRRIFRRMQTLNLEQFNDYLDYLEVHPDEFGVLFNAILINVTDFFRDEPAWKIIADDIVPRILATKKSGDAIRVWSAGCASGQEVYTIAMLLCEAMGGDTFRHRTKIYATDVDEEAMNEARLATYNAQQIQAVPAALREKYFTHVSDRFVFSKDVRRSVIFGRHDLLQDAPISRIDLLICRNTMMYFNAEAQSKILSRFDFAINSQGYLFLGKAEVLLTRSNAFVPVDMKRRIFGKLAKGGKRDMTLAKQPNTSATVAEPISEPDGEAQLRDMALDLDPVAQVVLNLDGLLVVANARARALFGIKPADLRQRLQDLQLTYRLMELRHMIQQAIVERRSLHLSEVEWTSPAGESRFFDIVVIPLADPDGSALGIKVLFNDVSRFHRLQEELQHSHQELETANEELQSTVEELETTNEELQSTVEELETTNEELQSTNEELETMNEELQSTNEELETANSELNVRGKELNSLNAFLESIMAGMRQGVIVLDRELYVRAWNERAEDLWGLRADEVRGQHFFALDIGLPVIRLNALIRAGLSEDNKDAKSMMLEAINRRGKTVMVDVMCTQLKDAGNSVEGVILVMEEQLSDGAST